MSVLIDMEASGMEKKVGELRVRDRREWEPEKSKSKKWSGLRGTRHKGFPSAITSVSKRGVIIAIEFKFFPKRGGEPVQVRLKFSRNKKISLVHSTVNLRMFNRAP